jgi:uncharacterized protein
MLENYVIHITKECNCSCKYCYEKDKVSTYSWFDIEKLLNNIKEYNKEFSIEFLGGEPLLAFDLIKKSCDYLESFEDIHVLQYIISSNGTILNQEIIDFLKNTQKVIMAFSIDGTEFMNCLRTFKNGYNTHSTIIENIKVLQNNNIPIICHMTIHPYNVGFLANGIDYLYDLGIKTISIGTIESTIITGKEFFTRYIQELDLVSQKIINNEYPGLLVDILSNNIENSKQDQKHYIYNNDGIIIAETYGRAKNDIKDKDIYITKNVSNNDYNPILEAKLYINKLHQSRIKNGNGIPRRFI